MELDKDTFPSKMRAREMNCAQMEELNCMIDTQSLDSEMWCGLLLYHKGAIYIVVRDVHYKYEVIEVDYEDIYSD
jgi:hypothetical protein